MNIAESSGGTKKISQLKEGEQDVAVKGRVIEAGEPRTIITKRGQRTISDAVLGDETGRVRVTLWGDKAGSLEAGQAVKIEGAWTTAFKGKVQLNVGARSKIEALENSEAPEADEIPENEPKATSGFSGGFEGRPAGRSFRGPPRRRRQW
ncbi:MAG: OB-fold nucleic acid binding domain-containing protein [Fervidicoccaceae archaeon]